MAALWAYVGTDGAASLHNGAFCCVPYARLAAPGHSDGRLRVLVRWLVREGWGGVVWWEQLGVTAVETHSGCGRGADLCCASWAGVQSAGSPSPGLGGAKGAQNFWATGGGDHTFRTTYFGACDASECLPTRVFEPCSLAQLMPCQQLQ
eukprot:COSAG02_NODE_350_length_24063_cov_47.131447_11_plen_149_part_00